MTPDEYERYKQAEKEHFEKLKALKQAVRGLERQRQIQSAVNDMDAATGDALDARQEAVDRLAMETARGEARLEMALDAAKERSTPETEELDAEMQRERARRLVRSIRSSMGDADVGSTEVPPPEPERAVPTDPTQDPNERPDKTIGRM